jgi:serine/threonine protein kinase
MYIGFTGATGPLVGVTYDVHSWSFSNEGNSSLIVMPASSNAKSSSKRTALIAGIAVGVGVVSALLVVIALAFMYRRRRRYGGKSPFFRTSAHEQVELSLDRNLPQRYSYSELSKATQNFNPKNLLGSGGFGSVYKGKIPSTLTDVAVKRISQGSKQGVKEFVSEVTTIGQLRHRNLAPLLGWCQERGGFMLVYELMPNGSLDQFLFKTRQREKLSWPMRLHILKGVAAAVNYLHEECEKKIVHRDIKASNVMLDAQMNARLGDFGLARLYGHDVAQGTTNVAGTWGYMAPESFYTRKATEKTDVFSFGVLALEVVTGRKVSDYIEKEEEEEDCALMEWLWRLHANKTLSKAVDPSLAMEEEEEEEEESKLDLKVVVLELGLSCCYALPEARPTMRNVLHVLSGEAPPISLPPAVTSPYLLPPREREDSSSYQVSAALSISSSAFSTESVMRP